MPGEILSCVGCHEKQNDAVPNMRATALTRAPSEIAPWYGPVRGFSFPRDVQPVLDKYCVGCHDGKNPKVPNFSAHGSTDVAAKKKTSGFTSSYLALHPYVRRPGPESDYHILVPAEYCANTSELIQMLRKGHRGVKLDAEAWDRLITWIDLNVPDFGTWTEQTGGKGPGQYHELRLDLRKLYANVSEDPEAIPRQADKPVSFIRPAAAPAPSRAVPSVPGWPFDAAEARRRQQQTAPQTAATADLGGGVKMTLRLIPAGEFVIGDPAGNPDELPPCRVKISQPFWMAATEVTNAQFGRFDPAHDSRYIDQQWKDHTLPGYPANQPDQPVIRVSWEQATAFCRWLSERTGRSFALPSEVQWEYAARAGANTALSYGGLEADFSKHANMADASIKLLAVQGVNPQPVSNPSVAQDFLPRDTRFNDGQKIVCEVGKYAPNAWGLFDMHGNVAEWTRSIYRPYPYADDARNDPAAVGERVVRGGSWMDRPAQCRSAFRLSYPQWQKVYNVGFRVVCPAAPAAQVAGK